VRQQFLQPLAFGNVTEIDGQTAIRRWVDADFHPCIQVRRVGFELNGPPLIHCHEVFLIAQGRLVIREYIPQPLADKLIPAALPPLFAPVIDISQPPVRRYGVKSVGDALQDIVYFSVGFLQRLMYLNLLDDVGGLAGQ